MDKPHDRLFRKIFDDVTYARELLEAVLPSDLVQKIDFRALERLPDNLIKDDGREIYTDLLFRCRLYTGEKVYAYILVEHKSRATRWLVVDLLRYATEILQIESQTPGTKRLPIIIPVGIVHDPHHKQTVTSLDQLTSENRGLLDLLGNKRLSFGFFLADLADIDDRTLIDGRFSDAIKVTFLALKHARDPERFLEIFAEIGGLVRELLRSPTGIQLFNRLIDYTLRIAAGIIDVNAFARELSTRVEKMAGNIVTTMADKLREEGFRQGIEKGIEKGIGKGQAGLLLNMLKTRFGPLPETVSQRVETASLDDISVWSIKIFEASSLDDVFDRQKRG